MPFKFLGIKAKKIESKTNPFPTLGQEKANNKGICETIKLGFKERNYCKFCWHKIPPNTGTPSLSQMSAYFKLYKESNITLDEADIQLVVRLFKFCGMCQYCFHPFVLSDDKTGKKSKIPLIQTHWEIINCWVFILFVWWWLLILLLIPGLCAYTIHKLNVGKKNAANTKLKYYNNTNDTNNNNNAEFENLRKHFRELLDQQNERFNRQLKYKYVFFKFFFLIFFFF